MPTNPAPRDIVDSVPLDQIPPPRHTLARLHPSHLGGTVWACQCSATGVASTTDDALDAYIRHNPVPRNPHRLTDRSPANIGRA